MEDRYPSSESDEEKQAEKIIQKKKSRSMFNRRLNEEEEKLTKYQEHITEKYEDKQRKIAEDYETTTEKRAMAMELFMDLDKNNDNFVDRKDLIKYYGMLKQIDGASVEAKYKCRRGHPMIVITHD